LKNYDKDNLESDFIVFDNVKEAVAKLKPELSMICVPPKDGFDAIVNAIACGIKFIVCITDSIPIIDLVRARALCDKNNVFFIGPNSAGVVRVGESKIGVIPNSILSVGYAGVVSTSGSLLYEVVNDLSKHEIGQSFCVGLGGDSMLGVDFIDIIRSLEKDDKTKVIILIGEIECFEEDKLITFILENTTKPIITYIPGFAMPKPTTMGHARLIINSGKEGSKNTIEAFRKANMHIVNSLFDIASKVKELV
jgi:succinyl-CoA synthetase alpha subunit